MGDFSVSDPVGAMELRGLHGDPGISSLNELSKKIYGFSNYRTIIWLEY